MRRGEIDTKQNQGHEHVAKLIFNRITDKQCAGDSVLDAIICERAKMIHTDLFKNKVGMSKVSV